VLAAKTFYFVSDVVPCQNKTLKHFKILLKYLINMEPQLYTQKKVR